MAEVDFDRSVPVEIDRFGSILRQLVPAFAFCVFLVNIPRFVDVDTLQVDAEKCGYFAMISLVIGLPTILNIVKVSYSLGLSVVLSKLGMDLVLVSKVGRAENIATTTVLVTDKTLTLTTGEFSASNFVMFGEHLGVSSTVVDFHPGNPLDAELGSVKTDVQTKQLEILALICAMCRPYGEVIDIGEDDRIHAVAGNIEASLTILAERILAIGKQRREGSTSLLPFVYELENTHKVLDMLGMTVQRRIWSALVAGEDGHIQLLCRGEKEKILKRCTHALLPDGAKVELTLEMRGVFDLELQAMEREGFQLELCAYVEDRVTNSIQDMVATDLTLVGAVGIEECPRWNVKESMRACIKAKVSPVVVTGDNKFASERLCRDIGLFSTDDDVKMRSLDAPKFSRLNLEKQREILDRTMRKGVLFSGASPQFKQNLVKILQNMGNTVTVVGDGRNDFRMIKQSDIGITMGLSGVDDCKREADFLLLDDEFANIIEILTLFRLLWNNARSVATYILICLSGQVMTLLLTGLTSIPEGIMPKHLFFLNMVAVKMAEFALTFSASDRRTTTEVPQGRELITRRGIFRILLVGLFIGLGATSVVIVWYTNALFPYLDLSGDGHTIVSYSQLTQHEMCNLATNVFDAWHDGTTPAFKASPWTAGKFTISVEGCDYFVGEGKMKACTLCFCVLLMTHQLVAWSSVARSWLFTLVFPLYNLPLVSATLLTCLLEMVLLYHSQISRYFGAVALTRDEWILVVLCSVPAFVVNELFKLLGPRRNDVQKDKAE
uniref:Cation-transporting P-type ATPase C-terminal domain-containing protein n=2 Tax=Mucochytrium quahogii TaxID=96639 RepID=A0A7S2S2L6_9STRA|mmetsp:Transcript_7481/g.12005  ORF Transcript_7481/g.12005 Transcript_7481/m.12005 type:complete len:779 (+) Transcript_7481:48-2384(+)